MFSSGRKLPPSVLVRTSRAGRDGCERRRDARAGMTAGARSGVSIGLALALPCGLARR
jgi:hypothetical protein